MRFATSLLASLLAATTLATPIAQACGGGARVELAPRALIVSSHNDHHFIALGTDIEDTHLTWLPAWPRSYDSTEFAKLDRLATPETFTLVGPSGSRVINTDRRVALRKDWRLGHDGTRAGLEITLGKGDELAIALEGKDPTARWHSLVYTDTRASLWLAAHGVTVGTAEFQQVQQLPELGIDLVTYGAGANRTTAVRRGFSMVAFGSGYALGAVETAKGTFVVLEQDHQLQLLAIPATARS